jgi:hypothetical protein
MGRPRRPDTPWFKEWRSQFFPTQKGLADALGFSNVKRISDWESGRRRVDSTLIVQKLTGAALDGFEQRLNAMGTLGQDSPLHGAVLAPPIQSLPDRFEECEPAIWCKRWESSERLQRAQQAIGKASEFTNKLEGYLQDQDALHGFDVIDGEFRAYLGTLIVRTPLPAWVVEEMRGILKGWWTAIKYACSQGNYHGPANSYAPFRPSPEDANRTRDRLENAFSEAFSNQLELLDSYRAWQDKSL